MVEQTHDQVNDEVLRELWQERREVMATYGICPEDIAYLVRRAARFAASAMFAVKTGDAAQAVDRAAIASASAEAAYILMTGAKSMEDVAEELPTVDRRDVRLTSREWGPC